MKINQNGLIIGALAILIAGSLFYLKKNGVAGVAADVAAAAVDAVAGAATGTVLGVGDAVGIPRTNMNACQQAIADGRTWDASFACPAGTFLGDAVPAATGQLWTNIKSLF